MKCFEVTINGEKVCTAGVGDDGVLTSILAFVKSSRASDDNNSESLDLRVGGLTNREFDVTEHLEWLHRDLAVGDEIVIRIIEASVCDEPKNKEVTQLKCSFCGKKQFEVVKLIAGPAVYICNECVGTCSEALAAVETTGSSATCSFCGKKPIEVVKIVGVATARICNECVKICQEILAADV